MRRRIALLAMASFALFASASKAELQCETKIGACSIIGTPAHKTCTCFAPWGAVSGIVSTVSKPVAVGPKSNPTFQFKVSVTIDCKHGFCDSHHNPAAGIPSSIISVVKVSENDQQTPATIQLIANDATSQWATVPLGSAGGAFTLAVPNEDSRPTANKMIRNRHHPDEKSFNAKSGDNIVFRIVVRPYSFNGTRMNIGKPALYSIEGISLQTA